MLNIFKSPLENQPQLLKLLASDQLTPENLSYLVATTQILLTVTEDEEVIIAYVLEFLSQHNLLKIDQQNFSKSIINLVHSSIKLEQLKTINPDATAKYNRHQESLRKMLISLAKDIRVVFIVLAKQLQLMRNLKSEPAQIKTTIALQTREIFAPLANRLGIWRLKWELEDLTFRYLEPEIYQALAKKLANTRIKRENYITQVSEALKLELERNNIKAQVFSRSKHIYSIHKKMRSKNLNFEQLFDLRATRVLTNSVADCYSALGVVHNLWTPVPHEFDDYISNPKPNNYRSLHTAVMALDNQTVEVQIRTLEMHDFAESGVAAHWRYKENSKYDANFENKIKWLRQLLTWQEETDISEQLAEEYIYVLSPQGEVVELPLGATALDFAYYIHTDLGHRTRGAKANQKIIPLTQPLTTMQQVEILTTKEIKPAKDWMDANREFLKTSSARAKVKTWFRKQGVYENIQLGKSILHKEAKRLHIEPNIELLTQRLRRKNSNDLLAAIGIGDINIAQLIASFEIKLKTKPIVFNKSPAKTTSSGAINIEGVDGLLTIIANCCHPVPGDDITGFITQNRGVAIHRQDCAEVLHLNDTQPSRIIEISWSEQPPANYTVSLRILAYARATLLKDLTLLLADEKVLVESLQSEVNQQINTINLSLAVQNISQLTKLLNKIEQVPNVLEVTRQ